MFSELTKWVTPVMIPANTKFAKKIISLSLGLGAMMAVSGHVFAEEDRVAALAPKSAVPALNDWRQLDLGDRSYPSANYEIRAGALLKDAFVGLRSLFTGEEESAFAPQQPRPLILGFGDAPYLDNGDAPAPKIMGKTASTATNMIEDIITTAWLDQEVRALKERDGTGDFDAKDPWRMGIRLNMPF